MLFVRNVFTRNVHYMGCTLNNANFLQGQVCLQAWNEDNGLKYNRNRVLCLQYFLSNGVLIRSIFLWSHWRDNVLSFILNTSEFVINTQKLFFEDVTVQDRSKQTEFISILSIFIGMKKLECSHGSVENRSLKKKRLDENIERVYIYEYISENTWSRSFKILLPWLYLLYSELMYSKNWHIWLVFHI